MSFIEWGTSFELGVKQFDDHHKHLVSLINRLYDDYTTEAPTETVGAILDELFDYASYHFITEELWMEKQEYPNLLTHSEEHDKFCNNIIGMKLEYNEGKLNLSLDIMIFLKNWLTDHILKTDAEYGRYIAQKGVVMSFV